MTKEQFIERELDIEGRVYAEPPRTDQPTGPGGVTLAMLRAHRNRGVSVEDLKTLTVEDAKQIMSAEIDKELLSLGFSLIGFEPLRLQLLDFAWNSGPELAVRYLQRSVGLPGMMVDGKIGPRTLAALMRWPQVMVNNDIAARRAHAIYYGAVEERGLQAGVAHRALEFVINET